MVKSNLVQFGLTFCYRIVASLVRARPLEFFFNIIRWLLVAIPATWTNSQITYVQNKLAIAYRTRLTKLVLSTYLGEDAGDSSGKIYYKIGPFLRLPFLLYSCGSIQPISTIGLKTPISKPLSNSHCLCLTPLQVNNIRYSAFLHAPRCHIL
jgi:hypothetical protein